MKKTTNRAVLLADVVGSRKITARKKFEQRLSAAVQKAVTQYADVFDMPLKTWKGLDEVAAVLKKPQHVYEVITSLQDAIAPEQMRFVMVVDVVDIVPANRDVTQADGPAFHKAAALMLSLKATGLLFACATGNAAWDKAMATQLNLLLMVKQDWTERQRKIYEGYVQSGRQEEVARQMKVTQQGISKTLRAIHAFSVQQLEEDFMSWCAQTMNQ